MAENDYAVVCGINNYPGMGDTPLHARDLQGPINDATDVHAWLTTKGGVPAANASLICSPRPLPPDFGVYTAQPVVGTIVTAFRKLADLAKTKSLPVGRRLYVYMSGHGFAPERAKGAVFAADATDMATEHVFATAWLDWFYNAAYFQELVLWLDCCMTFHFTVVPQLPSLKLVQGNSSALRAFTAYSARFKQQSVEALMPDGRVHGVFTYTLLQGLDSAVDADGNVTTASLKQYLINRMKFNLPDEYKKISIVAQEPDFGFDDPLVFVQGAAVPPSVVPLPGVPDGTVVDVVGGNPSRTFASVPVQNGSITVTLRPGVYVARVPGTGAMHPFEL